MFGLKITQLKVHVYKNAGCHEKDRRLMITHCSQNAVTTTTTKKLLDKPVEHFSVSRFLSRQKLLPRNADSKDLYQFAGRPSAGRLSYQGFQDNRRSFEQARAGKSF